MDCAMENTSPILLCVGSVGCGKSVTASAVIDWLNLRIVSPEPYVLSYYVDAFRSQPPTASDILRALIRQITIHYKETDTLMPTELQSGIEAILASITSMTDTILNLTAVLQHFLQLHTSCYIVLDGIDALSEPEILVFVNSLREIWRPQPGRDSFGRLMLFCRETLGRRIRLDRIPASVVLQIKIEHLRLDLHVYVDSQVNTRQSECPITSDDVLIDEVKTTLKSDSEKMFLWVHLQILSLWDPGITTCDQDKRDQLKCLPEGLDEVYIRCLRRINTTNDKRSREIAPRMFRWLASAQMALSPLQAREAVSMTPNNLPLNLSQVLSSSVTDYCANLVVRDDLTGTIKFAHPSVKDFLSDSDKMPSELRHLSLLNEDDELWCGRICVAHAKLHNSRNQVVVFRSQKLEPKIASPVIRNVFATISPFKFRPRLSKSQSEPFRMPLSAVSRRKTSAVEDSSLHEYIRQHWLTHCIAIREDHAHYTDFTHMCLSHDPDLQPWSTTQLTDIEHYRRMVMHAVMLNHVPLLKLTQITIEAKGSKYHQGVFDRFAPGTDSTYLHCAATLGHIDVLRLLLDVPGYHGHVANAQCASAALVAMQAQQMEAFELLLIRRSSDKVIPVWFLSKLKLEEETYHARAISRMSHPEERLLDHSCIEGNLQAVRLLLSNAWPQCIGDEDLSSAFFLACSHGQQEIGILLMKYGADAQNFRWTKQMSSPRISRIQGCPERSAFQVALETRDLKMMRTLLAIRRSLAVQTEDLDLIEIMEFFGFISSEWDPFVALASEFGACVTGITNGLVPWWLEQSLERIASGSFTYAEVDHLVRVVLRSSPTSLKDGKNRRKQGFRPITRDLFMEWFQHAAVDVLVQVVNTGWIDFEFLVSNTCLYTAYRRGSSRVLEATISLASCCEDREERLESEADVRAGVRGAQGLMGAWLRRHYKNALGSAHTEFHGILGQIPTLEFLLYSNFEQHGDWLSFGDRMSEPVAQRILRSIKAHNDDEQHSRYPCLMWIRCYARTHGDVTATRALCDELQRVGGDGNFALNFPAGYNRRGSSTSQIFQWQVSKSIRLAIHRWSFRLNRARGKPFSESDKWCILELLRNRP